MTGDPVTGDPMTGDAISGEPVTGWFDSHCHLQERYRSGEDPVGPVSEALRRTSVSGVDRVVCVGTDAATSAQALDLAAAVRRGELGPGVPAVWATVGLHPHEASSGTAAVADLIGRAMAGDGERPVAVGECGLDYHYEHSSRAEQRQAFAEQIAIARHFDLALVVHARDAWDDLLSVLGSEGVPDRTVLHCFTGGPAEAARCLEAGLALSFSGIVTFKNAAPVREAAARCPLDRLLVETDSPFLAPVPHRGRPNEPALVPLVGAAVAAAKGLASSEVARASAAAAARLFAL